MRKTAMLLTPALLILLAMLLGACGIPDGAKYTPAATDAKQTENIDPGTATDETTAATPVPTELPWKVDDKGRRLAGTDSGITRDGTPKKYFTISFDDGITQDRHIIEIYNKYNFRGTFFINTGLFGTNWTWVGQALGDPSLSHLRWTRSEISTGIYDGQDVASHTLNHASLKDYTESQVINEIDKDIDNIYGITGICPVGIAWPGGDTEYTNTTMEIARDKTSARFARATTSTNRFNLPKSWLKWQPTCGISDASVLKLAENFLNKEAESDMLFYVWGHGYELDLYNKWDTLEQLIRMMTEAEDVICVTNSEFYWLFADEIPPIK